MAGTPAEPEAITMLGLVDDFRRIHATMEDRAFAFVLGAGASRTSGIQTATQMVAGWIEALHRRAVGATADIRTWATAETLGIDVYDPDNPAAAYPALYRRMYRDDPASGYAFLEAQMLTAEPSYGYSVLGRLLATQRHRVVITTNFDNLVADSLSIFSKTYPLVCGHEALAPFARARPRRPLVVKVHHDLLYGPKSMPEELTSLPDGYTRALADLIAHYTPIVIGYGGNDGSLMGFFEHLPERAIPGGVYWCYWDGGGPPPANIRGFVARQRGKLVAIPGFDELMTLLGEVLDFDVPDKFVPDRAKERADRIVRQAQQLKDKLRSGVDPESAAAPTTTEPADAASRPARPDPERDAVLRAMQRTMDRQVGSRRWWQWQELIDRESDPTDKRALYRAALAALPDSTELLNNYALYLDDQDEPDPAEALYRRVLEISPNDADVLGNYACLLWWRRADLDAAEAMFQRALQADVAHANNLCTYARFRRDERGDRSAANELFLRALACPHDDPYQLVTLGAYCVSDGAVERGLEFIEQALALRQRRPPDLIDLELWMLAYCARARGKQALALRRLRRLIVRDGLRIRMDFDDVLAQTSPRHPEAAWLPKLVRVLHDEAPPESLDEWPAWRAARV